MGDTWATLSPGIAPEPLRFLYHEPRLRRVAFRTLLVALVSVGSFVGCFLLRSPEANWYDPLPLHLFGSVCAFATIVELSFVAEMYRILAYQYTNALLTPGVVLPGSPVAVVVLASLGDGLGPELEGLRRIVPRRPLPDGDQAPRTRSPLVSTFQQGRGLNPWVTFHSMPIAWGTGRDWKVAQCLERLDATDFKRLEALVARGILPEDEDELIFLDRNAGRIQRVSIKDETKRYPADKA